MSALSAYTESTSIKKKDEPIPVEQDAATVQRKADWLAATETQAFFKAIAKESDQLIADAVELAQSNHQQDNNKLIIKKLVEAKQLQKVLSKYAKVQ